MALLDVRELHVSFGSLTVLDRVDLRVDPGQIVGLIGPNGAGKTTCIDALAGLVASRGRISFDGRDIEHLSVHGRARAGIGRTWQTLELFDDLTVRDHLRVASEPLTLARFGRDIFTRRRAAVASGVDWALETLGLQDVTLRYPPELSQGQRKLVSTARALAARPRLVCMDEPAAGLDTDESTDFGRRLRSIADAGTAVLLIEHDIRLVLELCDDVYVLDGGRVIAHGRPDVVADDPNVIAAYLGSPGGS